MPPSPQRTALVTGASRGIGSAVAVALGQRGFKVIVNYLNNHEAAAKTVALVEQAGGQAIAVQADVGNREDRARLLTATLAALGHIDVLINNAGIAPATRDDLLDADEANYDRVMDTNLKGPFFLTQQVARAMVATPRATASASSSTPVAGPAPTPLRCIININSVSAYAATINRSQYCIAKAGMAMMTHLFAARLAGEGIHVYEIRPGIIATDMAAGAKEKYDKLIHQGAMLPLPRWGQPDDVAKAVVMLVDGALPYSTGSTLDIDGGFHLRML